MSRKTEKPKGGKEAESPRLPSDDASSPPTPPDLRPHLSLDDPDSLAIEALQLYEEVKAGEMDSSEASRRANLLQVANNLRGSLAHRQVVDAIKRLVEAGVLPADVLRKLKSKAA